MFSTSVTNSVHLRSNYRNSNFATHNVLIKISKFNLSQHFSL